MNQTIEKLTAGLNEQQKLAVENPLFSCTKIVAGAGTGKTQIISRRFTKLVCDLIQNQEENPSSKLLVITFTDKAANEMKGRILKTLKENNISTENEDMWISTFHGFCSKILRRHSIEVNLTPDFKLAEASDLQKIYGNIIKALKYNEYKLIDNIEEICDELNLSTNILDISNLKSLSSISELDNVFTDIFNVIKKIKALGLTPKDFLQKTINSTQNFSTTLKTIPFGATSETELIINWQNHLRKYIDDFCVFEKETIFKELTKPDTIFAKNGVRKLENKSCAENFHENIERFETLELYVTKVIAIIYAIYQNELEKENLVDFDDLINKTILVLKNNIIIRAYYQKYFKHLIIDEFQDTNGSQLELIKLLLKDEVPNITFVGDRKQSIYGFRFAQMENLEVLHKYIEEKYHQNFPEIKLETNYRSTSHVLNVVNHVTEEHLQLNEALNSCEKNIINEENKYIKNAEITNFTSSTERKEAEAKYIINEIQRLKIEENVKYKDIAILVKSHNQSDLIEKILTSYSIPAIKKTNKSFFSHPAIKNAKAVFQLIKNPFDEIALTRILKIKHTDKELYDIKKRINELYFELSSNNEKKYSNLCEKIVAIQEENKQQSPEITNIFSILDNIVKNKKQKSLHQLFIEFTNKFQLYNAKTDTETFQAQLNLKIFEKIISDYEQTKKYTTILKFIEYLDKIEEDKNFELPSIATANIDAVQIMTIHASKGLEFPYTFVCAIPKATTKQDGRLILDLQYGKKPGFGLILTKVDEKDSPKNLIYKEIWEKPRSLNEKIRLFYVAVSRAEKYLNILSFTDAGKTKAAPYTKDFPNFVIKEEIDASNIEIKKEEKSKILIQKITEQSPILNKQIAQEKEINHNYSFSKLNTYNTCPNKFLLKYKYGYPTLSVQNQGAQIGNIVHKLIYNTLVYNQILNNIEINNLLKEFNVEENAKNSIIISYNNFLLSQYSPKNLENKEFSAEYNFKCIYKIDNKEINFIGDIDLLVKNDDNTYSIVDFKTNANIHHEKENYYNQLYLYKSAIESLGLKVKTTEILSLNNDGNILSIFLENEEQVKQNFETVLRNSIICFEQEEKIKKESQCKKCTYCEYNYICF